jgi:hypothetical protein
MCLINNFFKFFCNPDRKLGTNKEATNYQTYTKKRILNKLREKIVPFRLPLFNNNSIIFLNPLKEIDPFNFNDKSRIKIAIDTRILLIDFSINKEAFFIIPSRTKVENLGNTWDKIIKKDIVPTPELYKIYKNFRIDQYKDTVIKAYNIISFLYRGVEKTEKGFIVAKPIQPLHKKEFEDKILNESRLNKNLKKTKKYKPSNRKPTILTKQKIKDCVSLICFKTLVECNYIKQMPKLSDDGKYHIRINPFKLDKAKVNKLKNLPKITIN